MSTREKILALLADADGRPLSTRELAGEVGVSHVAVWKQLKRLETDGLAVRTRQGALAA